jgi:hypothetical protein
VTAVWLSSRIKDEDEDADEDDEGLPLLDKGLGRLPKLDEGLHKFFARTKKL